MRSRPKQPVVPHERHDTIRRDIVALLTQRILDAKEISAEVSVPEKEVYEHLEHIRKTMGKKGHGLIIDPAECEKCGFVFRKREKLKKPGRCPVCRSELIRDPLFSVELPSSLE